MTLTGRLGYLSCAIVASAPTARTTISIAIKRIMQSPIAGPFDSLLPLRCSSGLHSVQAVRGILDREKYDVAIRCRLAGVHGVGRNVDDRARCYVDLFSIDVGAEGALQHIDPLLVGMRVRLGSSACLHPHQADNHAVTFDTWPVRSRIGRASHDLVHRSKIENIFSRAGALGARSPCE